jgi:hypothetical protein
MVIVALVLDGEFKLETDFSFEFLKVELPLPHLIDVSERAPNL